MANGENVFLRKDGRFEARYAKGRTLDGKLVYGFCYGRTYQEAKEKAEQARRQLGSENGTEGNIGNQWDFARFCDNWLAVIGMRIKISSYMKYRTDIENHIKPFFGNMLSSEIMPEEIDLFTQMLLNEKKLSVKTVRDILALFRSILSYVEKRSEQKLHNLEIIYPKEPKKDVRVLNESEEIALIHFLVQDMDLCKFGVYMALRTGMRIGEICALKWNDISIETATISVRHTAQRLPRKVSLQEPKEPNRVETAGNKDGGTENADTENTGIGPKTAVMIGSPKSECSFRTIPLMPDIIALCSRFAPGNPEAFVLTGIDKCMEPRKLQRRLKKYMEVCNIEKAHFHTLRHTFATRCVEVGFDVKTLSEILGHSNIEITLNQYVHPNMDLKRENMSRLKTYI